MKLHVHCGVLYRGKPHGVELRTIDVPGFPGDEWYRGGNYERLRWEDRFYNCPKHGTLQIHEADLLHRALNPRKPVLLATDPRTWDRP